MKGISWWVDLHFLMTNCVEHLFSTCWSFVYLHWRNFCLSLLSISWLGCLSFCSYILRVLYLLWILDNIRYTICKNFLSYCGRTLHFLTVSWWCVIHKIFNIDKVQIIFFFSCYLYFWGHIQVSITKSWDHEDLYLSCLLRFL